MRALSVLAAAFILAAPAVASATATITIVNVDGGQVTGTGNTIAGTAPNMSLTDPDFAFTALDQGRLIVISGATSPGNNGSFFVTTVNVGTRTVTFTNANGVAEAYTGTWTMPPEGFNDPTPAAPVGGNPGTTLGEQRLLAFQHAADIWASTLDSSVEIRVEASFDPRTCAPTSAVLGSAGAQTVHGNFPNAPLLETWFPQALANQLARSDLDGAFNDIRARFNSMLGQPGCLNGSGWYYGFDANEGVLIDLVAVLLHEMGHGLGFQTFVNTGTGVPFSGFHDVYEHHLLDTTTRKYWDEMTNAERVASAINGRRVVFDGDNTTAAVPETLTPGTPALSCTAPAAIAGSYLVGTASFGPPLTTTPVTGNLIYANDSGNSCPSGGTPSLTDGCDAFAVPTR